MKNYIKEYESYKSLYLNKQWNDAKTGFGIPYSALVDLGDGTDPSKFKFKNDSGADWILTGWTAGGKLKYQMKGLCMPVNETILFKSSWEEEEEHDHDHD